MTKPNYAAKWPYVRATKPSPAEQAEKMNEISREYWERENTKRQEKAAPKPGPMKPTK